MADFFRSPDPMMLGGRSRSGGGSDHLRGHLERQPDGSVVYKVIFDVQGYSPDDLKTSLLGDRTVHVAGRAGLTDQATGKLSSMSFEEQLTLPDNVDASQLRSVVANSQLIISAPVLPPQYKSSDGLRSPRPQPQTHPSPKSTSPSTSYGFQSPGQVSQQPPQPQKQQQQPQQQQQLQSVVKRLNVYQLELDLGHEFSPADLKISTVDGGSRLVIHGQRQARSAGKTSFREFRDEFDLPSGLDLAKMTARIRSDGRVFVEAPFRADTEQLGGGPGFDFLSLPVLHH